MKILIKNAVIVTQNKDRQIINNGHLLISNGVIADIGNDGIEKYNKDNTIETIDASGYVVVPGLINNHVHLGESAYTDFLPEKYNLEEYLDITNNISKRSRLVELERETICEYSILKLIKNGVTTIAGGRTHKTAEKLGMRNVSGYMLMKSHKLGKYSADVLGTFSKEYAAIKKSLTHPAVFIHSLHMVDEQILLCAKELSKNTPNLIIMAHVAETKAVEKKVRKMWGSSSVGVLDRFGLLNNKTLVVHGSWMSKTDIQLVKKTGASLSHCLSSNLRVADKTADINHLRREGVLVSIATDGVATSGTFSPLQEARSCVLYHNRLNEYTDDITPQDVFDMITVNSAQSIGLENEIGSLEVGKKADLVFTKISCKDGKLVENLILNPELVTIEGVMINGVFVMWQRKIIPLSEIEVLAGFRNLVVKIENELGGENEPIV